MPARKILANRGLQAAVVVHTIECILLEANRCESQVRHTSYGILNRVRGDSVDGIGWARQSRVIDDVTIVADVDTAGSDEGNFQYVIANKFILDAYIVLAAQRRLNVVVIRFVEVA